MIVMWSSKNERPSVETTGTRTRWATIAYATGLVLVFLLAVFVRDQLWTARGGTEPSYLEWAQRNYFGGVSLWYFQAAEALARGAPYTTLAYPPGYPFFLSVLLRCGLTFEQIRVAQFVLDAAVVAIVAALLRSIGATRSWALAGAVTYAVHPLWATGSVYLLAEAFSPAIMVTFLWSLSWARRQSTTMAVVPGAIAGAGAMIRPDFLLLVLPGVAWFTLVDRRLDRLRAAALFAVVVALCVFLWGAHNRRVHGTWMFGTTASGAGLWEGLGELPNDYGYVLSDARALELAAAQGHAWASLGANAYFTRRYLKAVARHPGYVARVVLHRWDQIVFESERDVYVFTRLRAVVDSIGVVWLVAAIVVFRRRPDIVFIAAVPLLFAMFSIGLVHYEPRYVRYAQLSYVVSGLALLEWLWTRAGARLGEWRRPLAVGLVASVAIYTAQELIELHRFARTSRAAAART